MGTMRGRVRRKIDWVFALVVDLDMLLAAIVVVRVYVSCSCVFYLRN